MDPGIRAPRFLYQIALGFSRYRGQRADVAVRSPLLYLAPAELDALGTEEHC